MFFLRITFNDGVSPPETLIVKRPVFTIGTSRFAHLIIEGADIGIQELQVARGLGESFICEPVGSDVAHESLEGSYTRDASIDFGSVRLYICLLDLDLRWAGGVNPQPIAIETLRKAILRSPAAYPALSFQGDVPCIVSVAEGDRFEIGRSRSVAIRLDAADVSGEHARVSVNDGLVYVEDAESTNGTRVNGQFVTGKLAIEEGDVVELGVKHRFSALYGSEVGKPKLQRSDIRRASTQMRLYPCLFTTSDLIKPTRFVFLRNGIFSIGREPANDIWVGAAHISRRHCEIEKLDDGTLRVRDISSNGSVLNGVELPQEVWTNLDEGAELDAISQLDLGGGVVLYLCNNPQDETIVRDGGASLVRFAAHRPETLSQDSVDGEILSDQAWRNEAGLRGSFAKKSLLNSVLQFPGNIANRLRRRNFLLIDAEIPLSTIIVRVMATLCFCFLLGYVAYVLYGIAINL